jgi:hypothetical protein
MSSNLQKKVRLKAYKVYEIIDNAQKNNKYNKRDYLLKESCISYCSLMQYSEPINYNFWEEVKEYLKYNF